MAGRLAKAFGIFTSSMLAVACGASPQISATGDFHPGALERGRVLFVPLAVSQELGDERTGIVLSDETRAVASESACRRAAQALSQPTLVCLERERIEKLPAMAQVQLLFALDKPIPASVWQALRDGSGARHAILFRPEGVASSHEVRRELKSTPIAIVGQGILLGTTALVSGLGAAATMHTETSNDTELSYTVSASLVDMQDGKLLKVGVHSGSDSRKVKHNLGFAEPPPAAPILEKIMVRLSEAVLSD